MPLAASPAVAVLCTRGIASGSAASIRLARFGLLLVDEPFSALDALKRLRMHGLLRQLCAKHRPAVLLVTHDVDEAIALADRILVLQNGCLTAHVTVDLSDAPADQARQASDIRQRLLGLLGVEVLH